MKILHPKEGRLAILIPAPKFLEQLKGTEEEKVIHLANKQLPTGTKYEIINDDVDLSDRTFRNAWEYTSPEAGEKTSEDLSLDDQLKYNMITQKEYDASNN